MARSIDVNLRGALQGKIFGMPRWLFFTLIIVGVGLGIYLRRRNLQNASDSGDNQPTAEDYGGDSGPIGELPTDEPGLAGVGVASPPGGVYPVTTPMVPEGITEIIGTLAGTISDIATLPPNAVDVPADVVQAPATPTTGGGPPVRRPHTAPPKRTALTKAERIRRVRAIQSRHGARSAAAKRAAARLQVTLPKQRVKRR